MGTPSPDPLLMVLSCLDLTSLDDTGDEAAIEALCERAVRPDATDAARLPHAAAVCVYPRFVPLVRERLSGTGVRTAAAAGAFPSGRATLGERLTEITAAIDGGAEEIDTVLDHAAFLAGDAPSVIQALSAAREVCDGRVTLKVILETGALGSAEAVRAAGELAIDAGADFLKSSTGKLDPGARPGSARAMMETVRGCHERTGRRVGVKLAGGIRRSAQALGYVALAAEILGDSWIGPATFRIGASSLLEDVVADLMRPA